MRKRFYTTLTGKVILTTIAGILTIYIIHTAISHAFEEITENVDRLSHPNERLMLVNVLFRDVSQLNNSQMEEAASRRPNPSLAFINESETIYSTIDTLRTLFESDTAQIKRIDEIEQKLNHREKLFQEYLELQYRGTYNPDVREFLGIISNELNSENNNRGSQVFKVLETTTSTTVSSDTLFNEPQGFFSRIFGKRQNSESYGIVLSETHVNKEVKVAIDTIDIHRNDSLVAILENSLDSLHTRQLQQLARIQRQELELFSTNSSLIHEIISIINTVEREEIARLDLETRSVFEIARNTIDNLNYFAAIFISISFLLVFLIFMDISKSNRYRKKLELANAKARDEAKTKHRFLSNMSHEIRTPLQSIYGYAELALLQPDQKADIETIYQSASHLLNVVNEVLDYSKITSGHTNLEKILFDPQAEIKSVLTAMQPLARQKGLKLTFESTLDKPMTLSGDPFRLKQILFNLTGNAIKFTSEGEIRVIAGMKNLEKQVLLIIRVIDTGAGIPESQLPHLFEEYSRTDQSTDEATHGTGLGLSIVKKLIELQNGSVEVETTPGQGSSFTVSIPYEEGDHEPEKAVKTSSLRQTPDSGNTIVMLADDDPHIINLSTAIFTKINIQHQTFTNGKDLLDAFVNKPGVIVFLDIRMPGMGGQEVCKIIREKSKYGSHIKIFAFTAQALPDERQSILDKGFDGLIIKPFKESDILEALELKAGKETGRSVHLDLESIIKMTGDDTDQIRKILNSVANESLGDLRAIKNAFNENHLDNLILNVHRMAGRVGQAGAAEYASALRKLERDLQNGTEREELKNMLNEILTLGDSFISDVKGYIEALVSD